MVKILATTHGKLVLAKAKAKAWPFGIIITLNNNKNKNGRRPHKKWKTTPKK